MRGSRCASADVNAPPRQASAFPPQRRKRTQARKPCPLARCHNTVTLAKYLADPQGAGLSEFERMKSSSQSEENGGDVLLSIPAAVSLDRNESSLLHSSGFFITGGDARARNKL